MPQSRDIIGIKIEHEGKQMVLRHAWPCGEDKIGMFLVTPEEYGKSRQSLKPAFLPREEFFELEVL